jgi:hypothetical protein
MPTTDPVGPTISASSSDTSPEAQPMSSTRIPGCNPASSSRRRVIGFRIVACSIRRRSSASEWQRM